MVSIAPTIRNMLLLALFLSSAPSFAGSRICERQAGMNENNAIGMEGHPSSFALYPAASLLASTPITRETLPNGVILIVHPNSTSDVVGMEIVSRVGTRYEIPAHAGLTTLTLRVMRSGAGSLSGEDIRTWFEDRGAALDARAHPDYSEVGSAVMSDYFPEMARIMAELVSHAVLAPESFHTEQDAMVTEIGPPGQKDETTTYQSLRTLLADGTAYGQPENGLASTLMSLTLENVVRFYHGMFAPRQMIVCVSGNIKTEETLRLLRELFGSLPPQPDFAVPPPIRTTVREPSSMVLAGNGTEAWIMMGYLTPGIKDSNYPALSVLNAIIGGSNSGILTSLFRNHNGVYDSGSFVQPFAYQSHIVGYVRAEPLLWDQQQQKARPVINEFRSDLLGVFASVRDHGVTSAQVDAARQYVIGQYLQTHEHNRNYAGYLGWYEAIGLGYSFDQQFIEEVQKVTFEQVNTLARTYLRPSQEATVVMFPRPRMEEAE